MKEFVEKKLQRNSIRFLGDARKTPGGSLELFLGEMGMNSLRKSDIIPKALPKKFLEELQISRGHPGYSLKEIQRNSQMILKEFI